MSTLKWIFLNELFGKVSVSQFSLGCFARRINSLSKLCGYVEPRNITQNNYLKKREATFEPLYFKFKLWMISKIVKTLI